MSGKNYVLDSITFNVTVGTEGTSTSIKLDGYTIDACGNIEHAPSTYLNDAPFIIDKVDFIKSIYKIVKEKVDDNISSVTIEVDSTEINQIIKVHNIF